ncbi:MAG: hypothetical protein RLZZ58_2211, partial [Pseudomonadota bacterium]
RAGGADVTVRGVAGNHMTANMDFGTADYPAAAEVEAFVARVRG